MHDHKSVLLLTNYHLPLKKEGGYPRQTHHLLKILWEEGFNIHCLIQTRSYSNPVEHPFSYYDLSHLFPDNSILEDNYLKDIHYHYSTHKCLEFSVS